MTFWDFCILPAVVFVKRYKAAWGAFFLLSKDWQKIPVDIKSLHQKE
ncbi:MAG: hypothetical protein MJ196_05415 [Treponemataceae bacterium]|nr:hypothetical protein [Treponemataceae bacterium]